MINPKNNYEIERAIKFLVHKFEKYPRQDKPEILHGIYVGMYLFNLGYKKDIVITGILHDLLEETKTTFEEIKKEFGKRVAELVQANSFDKNNSNRLQRCIKMYNDCKNHGKEAIIIKAADLASNMPYIKFEKDVTTKKYLFTKWQYFIKLAKPMIGKEKVYKDLVKEFKNVVKLNH